MDRLHCPKGDNNDNDYDDDIVDDYADIYWEVIQLPKLLLMAKNDDRELDGADDDDSDQDEDTGNDGDADNDESTGNDDDHFTKAGAIDGKVHSLILVASSLLRAYCPSQRQITDKSLYPRRIYVKLDQ